MCHRELLGADDRAAGNVGRAARDEGGWPERLQQRRAVRAGDHDRLVRDRLLVKADDGAAVLRRVTQHLHQQLGSGELALHLVP